MDYDDDPRFSNWVKRYLEGSWEVDNGPGFRLVQQIERLNGLSMQAVSSKLFAVDKPVADFPDAQNTHRYEDAHGELYKVLLDGLDRDCIERLATRVGRPMNLKSDRTLNALVKVFPGFEGNPKFQDPLSNVSEQRRKSHHKERPPAQPMKAFEQFGVDLEGCVEALEILCGTLEQELGMDADYSLKRQRAVEMLPTIAESPNAGGVVGTLNRLVGKTVTKIEFGDRKHIDGVHESEAMIIHLDDGSMISVETGSNAQNVLDTEKASEFHVRFHVHQVPPEKP